ncbi:MAG: response regulator [Methylococcales bacterium]|jgi:two-component system, chemotaxis family, sensor histidine kinase and response regulator WspE|nr:response regulator [Methylococcales bacterium]MBT7410137.1 response regulator [Methylococcales bacterium]
MSGSIGDMSMLELFRMEVEGQSLTLTDGLLSLEDDPENADTFETLMRAAHSVKGAARMVGVDLAVNVAHVMEDCFVSAQEGKTLFSQNNIDLLLKGVDFLKDISELTEDNAESWMNDNTDYAEDLGEHIGNILKGIESVPNNTPETVTINEPELEAEFEPESHIETSIPVSQIEPSKNSTQITDMSMLQLFRVEAESQTAVLYDGILKLEENPEDSEALESLMRAAHSIKGAARMVGVDAAVNIAHVMEDCFVAAQASKITLNSHDMDNLLLGVDILKEISELTESDAVQWMTSNQNRLNNLVETTKAIENGNSQPVITPDKTISNKQTSLPKTNTEIAPAPSNSPPINAQLSDSPMMQLLIDDTEKQSSLIIEKLNDLKKAPDDVTIFEKLAKAAHAIKGSARMVNLDSVVQMANAYEKCFTAAQQDESALNNAQIEQLHDGIELLKKVVNLKGEEGAKWLKDNCKEIESLISSIQTIKASSINQSSNKPSQTVTTDIAEKKIKKVAKTPATPTKPPPSKAVKKTSTSKPKTNPAKKAELKKADTTVTKDAAIRVSASSLNRLMGLAGETMVESRWIRPFADSLITLKRRQVDLISSMDNLRNAIEVVDHEGKTSVMLKESQQKAASCREILTNHISELESYDRRITNLADRLNREVITSRMRPFSDGVQGFQRMVRDVSRSLGKKVKLDIEGLSTQVDRDILEKIEAPLNHLIRNGVDHGIEMPDEREAAGKPAQGTIKLSAGHSSGMLTIIIQDDGKGVSLDSLREKIVEKGLTTSDIAATMSEAELMEFLFLPSFSTKEEVTEISGRGVGLDVVHSVVQEMRGVVRASSEPGKGTRFHMQLPLTLSVIRALLVEISGEPYAIPLARIDQTLKIQSEDIDSLEGRQYFSLGTHHIGIISAYQVLELESPPAQEGEIPLIILGERLSRYGLLVERFLGERDLVVQVLDSRLGKIKNISAAAILDDGTPTLIIDVDDMLRSIDVIISKDRIDNVTNNSDDDGATKRILVVDDSITVREVERNLLEAQGYNVDVAVDGMDGWNVARMSDYDLIISDIDMPRMNGFEFVSMVKRDPRLKSTPMMIVSYKDREEDRIKGLEAGADYYLTKGSFHDDTLMNAVIDLIGKP